MVLAHPGTSQGVVIFKFAVQSFEHVIVANRREPALSCV
jgi:hypothetical protein